MAVGWASDTAVQDQIDDTINDEIRRAQSKLYHGESRKYCEECGEPIPEARHKALPGVRLAFIAKKKPTNTPSALSFITAAAAKIAN